MLDKLIRFSISFSLLTNRIVRAKEDRMPYKDFVYPILFLWACYLIYWVWTRGEAHV